ncbi:RHS repeat-associated core domain-containing protein [Aquimonas voraii]|uniref:RHS repeat-associated core domain-containing protein n=1 Tax=Aquimonas voraii TaxID=265719 RepID=A0A1G6ZKR2_9GAMM|nr:RHS repeat-associated core domain-containing protein [Aquimonas voraii]SDE03344.1 RHS repeat-associated core domain-containing protein [Aquimonas voraii]
MFCRKRPARTHRPWASAPSPPVNARGLPSERRDDAFGSARLRDTLNWDGNGNLTAINDLVGDANAYRNASRSMIYDGLDRLTVANSSPQPPLRTESPWAYSYAYASSGLLQSVSQAGVSTPVLNYAHNARGQMTGRQFGGQQFTLSWDSAHRVTQTWNAGSSVVESYRYDAHGHRARTVRGGETVYQVYTQSGDLLMERTSAGTTRKYARLGGRLIGETVNGARRAIHTDVIGSVRQKTDAFGTIVHEDVRAPYGSTLVGWQYQNGPAFTGHMEDGATGLTYMKARYYDPVAMRFISPDPVHVDLSTGGNFNRYWYANNNPYTYTDPDGRLACDWSSGCRELIRDLERRGIYPLQAGSESSDPLPRAIRRDYESIGGGYVVRVDSVNLGGGESQFEVHVYKDSRSFRDAAISGYEKGLRAAEVNTLRTDGQWGKHGKPSVPPDLGPEGQAGFNRVVAREVSRRGWTTRGPDGVVRMRDEIRRNLGLYSRYLGPAGVALEMSRTSLDRACEANPDSEAC